MKARADWGNRQGNSARCSLYFPNEINSLGRLLVPINHPTEQALVP